jgi:hypothetical protein
MTKPAFDPSDFDQLKSHVISLYPTHLAPACVPAQLQTEELSSLKRTIGSERFYFVVNMETFEITHSEGIEQWLGYYGKEFSLKKYWGLVHPGLQKLTHTVFVQMAEILGRGKFKLEFMVQRYSSMTAIRHAKGHYLLLKRTASVFQYDTENRLRDYLNEFTIIGEYNGEPLTPSFFTNKGEPEKERGQIVMQQVIDSFLGLKIFSPNELQVARAFVYQPGSTQKDIAAILNKSPHTIDTYCKRFLRKAREYFHHDFPSVNDAALYLQKNGLL